MAQFPWSVDGFAKVLVAVSDDDVREDLADALHARGAHVIAIGHAQTLHAAIRRAVEVGEPTFDLVIADARLDGCSPLHALSWARRQGFTARVVVVGPRRTHVDADSDRVDAFVASARRVLSWIGAARAEAA
ncbi:MAG: response regulator [Myxococcales bacterium]|nr:response regulator [Myxococcales bacterium]